MSLGTKYRPVSFPGLETMEQVRHWLNNTDIFINVGNIAIIKRLDIKEIRPYRGRRWKRKGVRC